MIQILTEPKSAIVKQYQKLLELDGVELEFDKEALEKICRHVIGEKDRSEEDYVRLWRMS